MGERDVLTDLITRLQRVALFNREKFEYRLDIIPGRDGTILFHFVCEEARNHHNFVDGMGPTVADACADAGEGIDDACDTRGLQKTGDK